LEQHSWWRKRWSCEAKLVIEEEGRVIRLDGDYAWVETGRKSACGACEARTGCGTAAIGKYFSARRMQMRAINQAQADCGDTVIIGVTESALLRSSLLLYLLPLVGLFTVALLVSQITQSLAPMQHEMAVVLGGAAGFVLTLKWIARKTRGISGNQAYQPVVLRTIDAGIEVFGKGS
jgi:sigma-E factor negative regulatory protein RseC